MSFKVFFTGFLNKKTHPKKNFIIEQFYVDKYNFNKKINFEPVAFPLSSKEVKNNYKFLDNKKKIYKDNINSFFKKNFPERKDYWHSTLDYWLIYFLSSIHIKYQKLKKIKKKYPNIKLFKIDSKYIEDIYQTQDFIESADHSELLNIYIYQKIAESLNIKLIDSNFEGGSKFKILKNRNRRAKIDKKNFFIRKIKFSFIYLYCIIRKPYLLIDIYSSRYFKIKCLLSSFGNMFPISSESIFLNEKLSTNKKILNTHTIKINEADEFDLVVNNIINHCFPKILFTDFDLKNFYFLKKIKGIINSINITSQDHFRFVISIFNKKKIFTLQHGGLYNMQKKNLIEEFEKNNSIFLGWKKLFSFQAYFNYKFINKPLYEQNKKIILFTTVKSINMVRYESELVGFKSNNDFVQNSFSLYKNLNEGIRKNLTIRYPKHNYNWNLEELCRKKARNLGNQFKSPNFFNLDSPEVAITSSRIFVCDHISTPFFEALYSGVPIIIYDDLMNYEFKDNILKILLNLKKNNIIHDSPEECAAFINLHYNNINDWWNNIKTKKAINNLKKAIFAKDGKINISNFL